MRFAIALLLGLALAGCASTGGQRISEPAVSLQQLRVEADGRWALHLRLQNYSNVAMRFDALTLQLRTANTDAGTLAHTAAVEVGAESADVIELSLTPTAPARLAVADALAAGRGLEYQLQGEVTASPREGKARAFRLAPRSSQLFPAPGLPGVLR